MEPRRSQRVTARLDVWAMNQPRWRTRALAWFVVLAGSALAGVFATHVHAGHEWQAPLFGLLLIAYAVAWRTWKRSGLD